MAEIVRDCRVGDAAEVHAGSEHSGLASICMDDQNAEHESGIASGAGWAETVDKNSGQKQQANSGQKQQAKTVDKNTRQKR